jgi:hypothetical protein
VDEASYGVPTLDGGGRGTELIDVEIEFSVEETGAEGGSGGAEFVDTEIGFPVEETSGGGGAYAETEKLEVDIPSTTVLELSNPPFAELVI